MPNSRHEDPLDPLPPLDGDALDSPEPDGDSEELIDDGTDATLDDATGEDDPADAGELDIKGEEGGWLAGTGEAQDLDVGAADIGEFEDSDSPVEDGEDIASRDEDLGFGTMPERGGLDAGEEGPLDADEELREADLPALDADGEGELDEGKLLDASFAADEPSGLKWSDQPWSRVGAPVGLASASAVACAPRGALVLGRSDTGATELARIDLEGTCERLGADGLSPPEVRRLSAEGDVVVTVLEGGRVSISWHGGEAFAPFRGNLGASDAVLAAGTLWLRTRAGGLLVENDVTAFHARRSDAANDSSTMDRYPIRGAAALACDRGKAIVALVADEAARPVAILRGLRLDSIVSEAIDAVELRTPALLAACGDHVAYAARRGGVVRRDRSGNWLQFAWEGRVTALTFVDEEGTLVAASYSELDDTTALVRLDNSGQAAVVARLGAVPADADSDGRVVAMAHDDARGVVWVAGGFGVAAFAVR